MKDLTLPASTHVLRRARLDRAAERERSDRVLITPVAASTPAPRDDAGPSESAPSAPRRPRRVMRDMTSAWAAYELGTFVGRDPFDAVERAIRASDEREDGG